MEVLLVMTARALGGAEIYVEQLVDVLGEACQFTIALSDHPDLTEFAQRLRGRARVLAFPFDRMSQLPSVACHLRRLASRFDVIHLNSNHPGSRLGILMGYVLPRSGRPVVCVEHGATAIKHIEVPRSIAWSLPTLYRWSRHSVGQIVAVSEENKRTLVSLYRLPADKITVVHNGVDLRLFTESAPGNLRQELGLAPDQPLILVLGRLAPNKGQRFLVEAAPVILAQFPTAHFVFAGSADGRAHLDERIRATGLENHFSLVGFRTDVANLLRSSDLFVLPSLAEGFSLAIIQALAVGLPVVATRVGGAAEIIEDRSSGFLVPPADAEALAQTVCHVLSLDAASKSRLRHAAQERAAYFSFDRTAEKMLSLYSRLAG